MTLDLLGFLGHDDIDEDPCSRAVERGHVRPGRGTGAAGRPDHAAWGSVDSSGTIGCCARIQQPARGCRPAAFDGATIQLVNTDPPYNVKVEPRSQQRHRGQARACSLASGNTHHQSLDVARHPEKARPIGKKLRAKDRPLANDFVSDEEFNRLLTAWFGNIARVLQPGRAFYIWGGYANCGNYPPVLGSTPQLYFSQAVIWVKEHPVLTRKDFMGNHEWCFYGWREGAAHQWLGPTNAVDVWSIKKVNPQSMVHLTEKPTELAAAP